MNSKDLSNSDFQAIAYFAIGVTSEGSIGNREVAYKLSFAGTEKEGRMIPVGNSGFSLGMIQTDLGQHKDVAKDLVRAYQDWAVKNEEVSFPKEQEDKIIRELGRTGKEIKSQGGKSLDRNVKFQINKFLASSDGITFIHNHDIKQIKKLEKNIFNPLKETNLYKQVSVEDKIKLATVNAKVYNQNEFLGSKILTGLQHNRYKNIQEITEMVDGFIKNKNNKPDYLESGYKHALKGANVITELIKANPSNPLFQAWEKISENPLANPNSFTGSQREDYLEIKHLFLNSDKAGKIIREHNMQPQLSPKQEKSLEKSEVDITRPLAKNASLEEYNDYAFAALLSDDDDKMHAALDSLLTSDIGRSTQQEAAALYERQEREEIARLEQMQHDASVMRMTRS